MLPFVLTALLSQTPDAGVDDDRRNLTVITGSRTERKAEDSVVATEVITRAQIEQLAVRDLVQLMQQQPGVELVYTNRGIGLRLQGLDPQYVLILVDGQRISGRSGAFTDISRFSLREIERVEIVKGPAAALYGADAIGGVINLITRRPQKDFEAALRGSFGTLMEGDLRGYVGSKLGDFELRAGGGYRTRNPYDWDPSNVAQNGPGIRRIDGDVEAAWVPSDKFRLWVRTGYVFTDLNAIDQNDTGAVFDRYQRTEQFDAWVGGRGVTGDTTVTVRGHFGLFRDQFLVDQRASTALDSYSQNRTRLWEGSAQVDHHLGRHTLTGGVDVLSELLLSDRINPGFVQRARIGVFVQDEWVLTDHGPRVAIVPGFRFDGDTQFGGAPSPRLAVKVDPSRAVTLRASWGLGFRPPTFEELYLEFANPGIGYVVAGNAQLKPEHSASVNVGLDWRPPLDGWVVSVSAWHTSMTDLINVSANGVPNPDDPVKFTYANVANAYTQGVEGSVRAKFSKGTYLELGYTGLDAKDLTRGRQLEGRSAHKVNAQVVSKYRPVGLEGVLRATWYSPRPFYSGSGLGFANVLGYGDEHTIWAPGYFDLEATLTYTRDLWRSFGFKLFVTGYNLLNSGDANFNPRPPRGVLGGMQLEI
jgi:outer membrane receptor for ferrienterochelin and colicins